MIYVYDTVITDKTKTLKRNGINYKLEKRFRMADHRYISFVAPGAEKMLVIPEFMEQYLEAKKIVSAFPKKKTAEQYLELANQKFGDTALMEELSPEKAGGPPVMLIRFRYRDIRLSFRLVEGELRYDKEFEIYEHNTFGNGIFVDTEPEHED